MTSTLREIGVKDFTFRVLSGVAIGIVVGLVPNAILGEIFKAFMHHHPFFWNFVTCRTSNAIYSTRINRSTHCFEI